MLLSKNTEIITKIKFTFEFDDTMKKELYLKTGDIALMKFYYGNDILTCEGKVTDILLTNIERKAQYTNITEEYKDALITFDCSKFYDGKVYKILSRNIIDLTIVQTNAELKGEPGDTQDLSEIISRLENLETNSITSAILDKLKTFIENTYVKKTDIDDMLTKTEAVSTYATKIDIEDMETKTNASTTYTTNNSFTELQSKVDNIEQEVEKLKLPS